MKVLVIGSGGREHAIAWKLAQSEEVERIYATPGNGGTAAEEKCENAELTGDPGSAEGQEELIAFAFRTKIDLTVVGPEAPLAEGIVDRFRAAGLAVIGPDKKAARLEASKVYSKAFMEKYKVRAAKSRHFTDPAQALKYAKDHFGKAPNPGSQDKEGPAPVPPLVAPLVIKADGLAAGKGVVIAADLAEAEVCLASFMKDKALGEAGAAVVLEEFLAGKEVSVLAAVSVRPGRKGVIRPFVSARDHKRRFAGAQGPNTGGMGAIAPVPDFTPEQQKDFVKNILEPTLKGMEAEGMDYRGFIFFGLMVDTDDDRCNLLEYNVRLGDPETQAVLPLMESDLAGLCLAMLDDNLAAFPLTWKPGAACAPVAVAAGYPGAYHKGDPIAINETALAAAGVKLFIAGAQRSAGGLPGTGLRTSGGRVLAASAWAADAGEARTKAYQGLKAVSFEGMDYRRDIGIYR
jgi:phosphoribosylamine--glycine ligase